MTNNPNEIKVVIAEQEFPAEERINRNGQKYFVAEVMIQDNSSLWGPSRFRVPLRKQRINGLLITLLTLPEMFTIQEKGWFKYGSPFLNQQKWVNYREIKSEIKLIKKSLNDSDLPTIILNND